MKLSNFKIGTRLAAAFVAMLALSIASGGLALHQISEVKRDLDDIVTVNNVKERLNNEMSKAVHVVSRVTRSVILLNDRSAMEAEERKIAAARASYDKAWEALQKMPASEEGQRKRDKIAAARDAARPLTNQALELGHEGRDEEATTLLMTKAGPATVAWQDALDENIQFQEEHNAQEYQAAQAEYDRARAVLVLANVLSVAIAAVMAWLVTWSITRPMAAARDVAERVAARDLTVDVRFEGRDETAQLLEALHGMKEDLVRVVAEVRDNADGVAIASGQIAQGNLDLSQRTEEQASNLQQTAASMEQLTAAVKNNADTARQAAQLAGSASQVAMRGGEVVSRVVETMGEISAGSQRIADIIGVVDGIAFQTNILALNAAVEAARAGEQGRGFAVVAGEVRTLAQRCAEAAKEIKQLIGASVQKVADGTRLVSDAGTTMGDIVVQVKKVADLIGEIDAATAEQTSGIGQINLAVTQLDQVTQQNAALVEESAAAADSLKHQAEKLVDTVRVFRMPQDAVASALIARAKAGVTVARPAAATAVSTSTRPQEAAAGEPQWETF